MQLVGLGTASVSVEVVAGFAVLFATAVDEFAASFAQSFHRKGRAGAIAQQTLQPCAVCRFDAHTSVHREAAMFVAQHLFGLKTLQSQPQRLRPHLQRLL